MMTMRHVRVTGLSLIMCVCVCLVRGWKPSESVVDPSLDSWDVSLSSRSVFGRRRLHRRFAVLSTLITPLDYGQNEGV